MEDALDEYSAQAATTKLRYTHEEVFGTIRGKLNHVIWGLLPNLVLG